MKKKIISILLVLCVCFLIFALADYLFARKIYNMRVAFLKMNCSTEENNKLEHNMWDYPFWYTWKKYPFEKYYNDRYGWEKRQFGSPSYKKAPILVFGCSFAEGAFLEYEEKFEYILSKLTNRFVYNMAYGGMGPATMLFQTQNPKMYDLIKNTTGDNLPEYAIYVYINVHEWRIYNDKYILEDFDAYQLGYNQKNGKLVKGENPLISFVTRFAIGKQIIRQYVLKYYIHDINNPYMGSLMKKYFIQSREELQKRYPDIKFVIMLYPFHNAGEEEPPSLSEDIWPELEKEGFIIYDLNKQLDVDIRSQEYLLPDTHPNAESWRVVTPKFVKDLKL